MKESDKREKILKKMKRWPWERIGMFLMDQEETEVVINALEVLESRKKYQHKRYLDHMEEKKQQAKANYEKKKAEDFRRLYDKL